MQAEQWKLVGNAVSVDIAKWLGQCLSHPLRHKYSAGIQDQPFKTVEPEIAEEGGETDFQVSQGLLSHLHLA